MLNQSLALTILHKRVFYKHQWTWLIKLWRI